MGRWRQLVLSLAAVAGAAAGGVVLPGADAPLVQAAPSSFHDNSQWYAGDGLHTGMLSGVSTYFNGSFNVFVYQAGAQWQGPPATPNLVPQVGQTFYVHIWTETANAFDASYQMKVLMPANLQLVAPTLQNDMYCEISNLFDQEIRLPGPGECAAPFMSGLYAVFPTVAMNINEKLHFWFPVKATAPMNAAEMQVLSDQSNNPIVSLPDPVLTSIWISAVSAPSAPGAPTSVAATPTNGGASISFAEPSNGGSAITNYQYSLNNGAWVSLSPADTTSPISIGGLANGTTYGVRIRAVNGVGAGTASASVNVTPRTVPAAPTALVATPGNGSVSVAFTAGGNGGAPISNYQYSLNGGAWTSFSPADNLSPVSITGLTAGTSYGIQLRAVNAAGAGTASASVNATPLGPPAAPTNLAAIPLNGAAAISFTPGANGGAAISNYQYSVNGGAWTALSPADGASPVLVPGLTNGVAASVRLRGVNVYGAGAASAAVGVTPAPTAPAAPTGLVATPLNTAASIAFVAGSNGGAPITNYEYSVNGGAWTALSPADAASPVLVKGLTNGVTYSIRLRAVNSIGAGAASGAVGVKPAPVPPYAPTQLVFSPRNGAALISFTPGNNGGAAITNYQYSVNNGAWKALSPADATSPVLVPGLPNGVLAYVRLRAVNVRGPGAASAAVAVRPSATVGVPAAPVALKASPKIRAVVLSFLAGSDGGTPIINYQFSVNGGPWRALSPADATTPITIPNFANGTTYGVRIRAVNAKGAGVASASVTFTTPGVPGAPTGTTWAGEWGLNPISLFFELHTRVNWVAPANGGLPITGYTVRWWDAPTGGNLVDSCTATTLTTCVSLKPTPILSSFWIDIVATNALGTGPPSARVLQQT